MTVLRQHKRRQLEERVVAGSKWQDRDYVFTNVTAGRPLEPDKVRRRFKKLLETTGLRNQRFHDLRHSSATLLLAQGLPDRLIMDTLGHSDIKLTMNTYAHVKQALRQEAADVMQDLLGAGT